MPKFICLHDDAVKPDKSENGLGYNLRAVETVSIPACERKWINIGIGINFDYDTLYMRLVPNETTMYNNRTIIMNSVVGPRHSSEIRVLIFNLSRKQTFRVKRGDIVAIGIIEATYISRAFYQGFNLNGFNKRKNSPQINGGKNSPTIDGKDNGKSPLTTKDKLKK